MYIAALSSLLLHAAFCVFNLIYGIYSGSWWLITLGFYYFILSSLRFFVLCKKDHTVHIIGIMHMALSLPFAGTVILSVIDNHGHKLHTIIMIAIAAYAFTKITLAVINLIKTRHAPSRKQKSLRIISFTDALVSIFALQRSMLVSFDGMTVAEVQIMNAVIGAAICVIIFLLGLSLICQDSRITPQNSL